MGERTEWDDVVDEAIGQLIDDATEGFVVVTMEETDSHVVTATDSIDQELLAAYVVIEEVRRSSAAAGEPMSPDEILAEAARVAYERACADGEVTTGTMDGET